MAGGVHDADRPRAVGDQQRALLGELAGADHVAHQQHRLGLHPEVAQNSEVALGDIGLRAVRGDPHDVGTAPHRVAQVRTRAPARRHEHPHAGVLQLLAHRGEHLVVAEPGLPELEGGGPQAVAVADLDHGDAGLVGRAGVGTQLGGVELVAHRVVAVAKRRIVQHHPGCGRRLVHGSPHRVRAAACCSAMCTAAALMMSKLPANHGMWLEWAVTSRATSIRCPVTVQEVTAYPGA